jgi:hypothetical protein
MPSRISSDAGIAAAANTIWFVDRISASDASAASEITIENQLASTSPHSAHTTGKLPHTRPTSMYIHALRRVRSGIGEVTVRSRRRLRRLLRIVRIDTSAVAKHQASSGAWSIWRQRPVPAVRITGTTPHWIDTDIAICCNCSSRRRLSVRSISGRGAVASVLCCVMLWLLVLLVVLSNYFFWFLPGIDRGSV